MNGKQHACATGKKDVVTVKGNMHEKKVRTHAMLDTR